MNFRFSERVEYLIPQREERVCSLLSIDELKAENRREGKCEGKREAARKMLAKGYPIEEIAEINGLSVREIQGLKKIPE